MEIKNGQLATQYQQDIKTQPVSEQEQEQEKTVESTPSYSDTVTISPQGRALYDDGGGHPDRPKGQS